MLKAKIVPVLQFKLREQKAVKAWKTELELITISQNHGLAVGSA